MQNGYFFRGFLSVSNVIDSTLMTFEEPSSEKKKKSKVLFNNWLIKFENYCIVKILGRDAQRPNHF